MDRIPLIIWKSSKKYCVISIFSSFFFFTLKFCLCGGLGRLFNCFCLPFQVRRSHQMILFQDLKCWVWFCSDYPFLGCQATWKYTLHVFLCTIYYSPCFWRPLTSLLMMHLLNQTPATMQPRVFLWELSRWTKRLHFKYSECILITVNRNLSLITWVLTVGLD